MKNKITDINKDLITVIKDAQKLALSFCDGMSADIFGKIRIKRSEYERKIYDTINAFSFLQERIGKINESCICLKSDVSAYIEKLYTTGCPDEAKKLCVLLSNIENAQNVCISVSEDCISKHVAFLDNSLSVFSSDCKEIVVNVSELRESSRAFHIRSEEYSKKLN